MFINLSNCCGARVVDFSRLASSSKHWEMRSAFQCIHPAKTPAAVWTTFEINRSAEVRGEWSCLRAWACGPVLSAQYQALVVSILINLYGLSAKLSSSVSIFWSEHGHTNTHTRVCAAGCSLLTVTFSSQFERDTQVTPALNANASVCALCTCTNSYIYVVVVFFPAWTCEAL